jgi:hypothetical protein
MDGREEAQNAQKQRVSDGSLLTKLARDQKALCGV